MAVNELGDNIKQAIDDLPEEDKTDRTKLMRAMGNAIDDYLNLISAGYTIIDATDQTVTLPDVNSESANRFYWRTGVGTGKVLFTTYGTQTIGGIASSNWFLENDEAIILVPDTDNWKVILYGGYDTSGNLILKPASGGQIQIPAQITYSGASRVRAKRSTDQSILNNTHTTVLWNTVDFDNLSEYNSTTGKFTAQKEGYYEFNMQVMSSSVPWAVNEYFLPSLWVNGSQKTWGQAQRTSAGEYYKFASINTIYHLNAGDYVEFKVIQNSGGTITLYGTGLYCYMSIHRLS